MERTERIQEIVRTESPRLMGYIRSLVDSREDAEDILQDVFYQLSRLDEEESYGIASLPAWLFTVARNRILNFWRKRRELPFLNAFADADEEVCEEISETLFGSAPDSPETVYLRKLVWQELDEALAELPPEQREVFCLTVFDGIPVKEISKTIGVPVNTLLSRKHYAVRFLRRRFQELYSALV